MANRTSDELARKTCREERQEAYLNTQAAEFAPQLNSQENTSRSATVILIEKRALIRDLLVACIGRATDQRITAVESIEQYVGLAREDNVVLVILSLVGDPQNYENQTVIRQVAEAMSDVPSVVLSDSEDLYQILSALEAGTRGYISTSMPFDLAIKAVRLVQEGGQFLPVSSVLGLGRTNGSPSAGTSRSPLSEIFTPRQSEVIHALRQGKANKIIAYELNMTESTVKVHVRNIMKRLKASNRTEVAYIASQLMSGNSR